MNEEKKIKEFWQKRANASIDGSLVTHGDTDQVQLEIDLINSLLKPDDILLDAGCGTGYSTSIYAKSCVKVLGVDYAESMIESAQKNYGGDNLSFERANVLELKNYEDQFTAVVSTRCLINLDSWDKQQEAIKGIHGCLKTNGVLIFAEGSKQGRDALNEFRVKAGLEAMPPVWHNLDFDEEKLIPFLEGLFNIEKDYRFGLYDVLTRVYYPMMIKPEEPQYGSAFHEKARLISQSANDNSFSQYSREFALVCRKADK